jgi:protein-L-isoaspartate O-methyltransferase
MTVEDGFRKVDRKFFVPKASQRSVVTVYNFFRQLSNLSSVSQNRQEMAHSDQPLKEGNVHISAPHIYGSVLEALELRKDTSLSFLNAGSGTGYLTCIAATILGSRSSHYCKKEHNTFDGVISRNPSYSQPFAPDLTLQVLKSTKMW